MNSRRTVVVSTLVAFAVAFAFATWWVERPLRTKQAFLGHLSDGRYEDASSMLVAPCRLELLPTGDLIVVDQSGSSTTVLANKLPFKTGGGRDLGPDEFSATALGPSTGGVLDSPAVTLRLGIESGSVRILGVDS
jgi:hypothetical protein